MTASARRLPSPVPRKAGRTYRRFISQVPGSRARSATHPAASPETWASRIRPRGGPYIAPRSASSVSISWKERSTPRPRTYSSISRRTAGRSSDAASLSSTSTDECLRDDVSAQVIGEVAPVGSVEQDDVGVEAGRDPPLAVGAAENVSGIDRASGQRLLHAH